MITVFDPAKLQPLDWTTCEAAVAKAADAPLSARPKILIDGCQVCGIDWRPILDWNTVQASGGPKRTEIESAMDACQAYCLGDARQKFLGTLDDARGHSSRMPWKQLGLICQARVSAVPDTRFVDAPYFALDRIARAIGHRGGELATRAFAIELPLPAVGVVGTGAPLATIADASPVADPIQITALAGTITLGKLPRAHMTKDGVQVSNADDYPGKSVALSDLLSSVKTLAGNDSSKGMNITLVVPANALAASLVPIVAALKTLPWRTRLAVHANESPQGWDLPGTTPVAFDMKATIVVGVTKDMNVQQLVDLLAKHSHDGVTQVGITGP